MVFIRTHSFSSVTTLSGWTNRTRWAWMTRRTRGTRRTIFTTIALWANSQIQNTYDWQLLFSLHKSIIHGFVIPWYQEFHLGLADHPIQGFPDEILKKETEKSNQSLLEPFKFHLCQAFSMGAILF